MTTTEPRKDPDVRALMVQVVEASRESNMETGRLLSVTGSVVSRLNVLVFLALALAVGVGVQLFLGFTAQELVHSNKVQLALDMQARATLDDQVRDTARTIEGLRKEVQALATTLKEVPKVTVGSSGQVNLEVHADEAVQNSLQQKGSPKPDVVSIPLNPKQSKFR